MIDRPRGTAQNQMAGLCHPIFVRRLVSAAAGLIAQRWVPGIGGLFLAFPAILQAGATLIEKHEKQKKNRAGFQGAVRGRKAAALDAAGAALGSLGLIGFTLVVWQLLGSHETWIVIGSAGLLWLGISGLCWRILKLC